MAHELVQTGNGHAAFIDDVTGNRDVHLSANSRVATTLSIKITQTSPGTVVGLGADTVAALPSGAVPIRVRYYAPLNDQKTGGTITIGIDNVTSNYFMSSYNVADAPSGLGQQTPSGGSNLYLALPTMPIGQFHTIVGHYAVAGTSTGGGPFYVDIDYYVPTPA